MRRAGGGRRPVVEVDPEVVEGLDRLIDPVVAEPIAASQRRPEPSYSTLA